MKYEKKIISILLVIMILITRCPVDVYGEETANEVLKSDIVTATVLLEELLQAQYDNAQKQLEDRIQEQELNYTLTMESFMDAGNPYEEIAYDELIAAVCTAVGNSGNKNITDLNFIHMNINIEEISQGVPTKIYMYEETDDGHYVKGDVRYITSEIERDRFIEAEDFKAGANEHYEKNGKEVISPEIETVKYGSITLSVPGIDELLAQVGLDINDETVAQEYNTRLSKIQESGLVTELLNDCTFVNMQLGTAILSEDAREALNEAILNTDGNRKVLIETAMELIGRVPYQWGGKSEKKGYDTSWYTYTEDGKQKGLDCSGYVQWVYRTAGYSNETWQKIGSTAAIIQNATPIDSSELKVGDLGILNMGESTNHTGLYVGNGYWIHCNSGDDTVNVTKATFSYYYRVDTVETEELEPQETETYDSIEYTQEELDMIADTVWNVAAGEGVNAWIALTEIIKNRLVSEQFPMSIAEILQQEKEFETRYSVDEESSKEKAIVKMVLDGQLAVLNDSNVLYYTASEENMGIESSQESKIVYKEIGNLKFLK